MLLLTGRVGGAREPAGRPSAPLGQLLSNPPLSDVAMRRCSFIHRLSSPDTYPVTSSAVPGTKRRWSIPAGTGRRRPGNCSRWSRSNMTIARPRARDSRGTASSDTPGECSAMETISWPGSPVPSRLPEGRSHRPAVSIGRTADPAGAFLARALGAMREQRLQGLRAPLGIIPRRLLPGPALGPRSGQEVHPRAGPLDDGLGSTAASLRLYSCRFIASPSIDRPIVWPHVNGVDDPWGCSRANRTGLHRSPIDPTRNPPYRMAGCRRLSFRPLPGQSPRGRCP